jgi:hypothetical protein
MIIEWQGERISVEQVRNLVSPEGSLRIAAVVELHGEIDYKPMHSFALRQLAEDIVAEHTGEDVRLIDDSVTLLGLGAEDSASLRDEIERLREGL